LSQSEKSNKMNYKLAQIILTPPKTSLVSDIHVSQPDSRIESLAGKMFVLAEIDAGKNPKVKILKVLEYLINALEKNYYQSEKILLIEKIETLKVEHIFEAALTKTNKNFCEFLKNNKIILSPSQLNITAGVIHDKRLHVASTGKNKVFLAYQPKKNNEEQTTKLIDIAKQARSDDEESPTLQKLFSNVISGQIPEKSHFLITNEALPEYISSKQIIEIITTLPPAGAAEQIKVMLSKINTYANFLGLIIKGSSMAEKQAEAIANMQAAKTQATIPDLKRTEENTDRLLAPTGIINLGKWTGWIKQKTTAKCPESAPVPLILKDKIVFQKKTSGILKTITTTFTSIGNTLLNSLVFFISIFKKKKEGLDQSQGQLELKRKIVHPFQILKSFKLKRSTVIIVMILIVFGFGASVYWTGYSKEKQAIKQDYQLAIDQISLKINQIKSRLSYGHEEGAETIAKEVEDMIAALPRENEDQINKYNELNTELIQCLAQIRKVEWIDNPDEVINLSNVNAQVVPQNLIFNPKNKKLYASDAQAAAIYAISPEDKLAATLEINEPTGIGGLSGDNTYYYNKKQITEVKSDNNAIKTFDLEHGQQDIKAIAFYNSNIYLLDSANQIRRHSQATGGFGPESAWITTQVDFQNAVDIGIDGNVYVLHANGNLQRFFQGKEEAFKLKPIEPELTSAGSFFVSPDQDYIYILDQTNKRVIVFTKEGKLVVQYQSNAFTDIKDFAVDENGKKIYILNANSIIKLDAIHL